MPKCHDRILFHYADIYELRCTMIIEIVWTFYLKSVQATFQKYLKHISWVISETSSSKLLCNPRHPSRNISCNHRHHLLQPSWRRIFSTSNNKKTRVDSDINSDYKASSSDKLYIRRRKWDTAGFVRAHQRKYWNALTVGRGHADDGCSCNHRAVPPSEEVQEKDMGIEIPDTTTKLACLLWMDDVLLLETRPKRKTRTNGHHRQNSWKIPHQVIGKNKDQPKFSLGQMQIEPTDKYKYLGETVNEKLNLKDHIKQIEGKVEAAYQAMLAIAGDRHFKNIHMETIWKLMSSCIIPIITYAGETRKPTRKKTKKTKPTTGPHHKKDTNGTTVHTKRSTIYRVRAARYRNNNRQKQYIMMGERLKKNGSQLLNEITPRQIWGIW